MPSSPHYGKGDTIGGQFLVHQALQGGMGEVYLCLKLDENIPVALKTFQQRYLTSPDIQQLFEEEITTWIALEKHPNIVRCFSMQKLNNQPFMMLEWVAGEGGRGTDLRGWLRHGPLDLRLALDFTIYICRGLIYANQKQPGIVHRDLKPDNILVSQGRLAKITDFGLSMVAQRANLDLADNDASDDITTHLQTRRAGGAVGTPPYMPPEQWQGGNIDARADIYAVGCILYELLTGQFPYRATTLSDFRQQHEQAPLPALPGGRGLPPALNDLLAGCLAKRPDDRFPDVGTLLEAVTTLYRKQVGEEPRPQPEVGVFTAVDYTNRGNTYRGLGRFEEALADCNRAIELDPALATAYANRSLIYRGLGRSEEALADCNRAIELDPADAQAYASRGIIYADQGRYTETLTDYTRAIECNPTYAAMYTNRSVIYRGLGRSEEALTNCNRAIELDPANAQAYASRGNIYSDLGRSEEALADYTRAIELDPTLTTAYFNRGNIYSDLGRSEEALADYTRAIELKPADATAYFNRGVTYKNLGRDAEALTDYTRAIELDPADATAYVSRGNTYRGLGRSEEALADYTRAIELDPTLATAYFNRGDIYVALGRFEEALTDYTRAIELDPTLATAYTNRGITYSVLGRFEEALADCNRAIDLDPALAMAYASRGIIYADQGRNAEALADYTRAIECNPTYAKAYGNIGVLLSHQGKLREALLYFEKAAQLGDPVGAENAAIARQELGMEEVNFTQLMTDSDLTQAIEQAKVTPQAPSVSVGPKQTSSLAGWIVGVFVLMSLVGLVWMQGAWDDEDEPAISTRQDSEVRERSTDTLTSTTSFEQNAAGEIAYIHEGDIYLLDLATGDAKQLTNDGTNRDPTWMPDGEWLAFASNREGNYNIYMMLDDGSQLTRLTNDPRDERFPSYASEEILFFVRSVDTWQQHELVELDIHAGETVISSSEGRCDITDISAFSPNMFAIVNDCRLGVSATIYTRPDAAAAFTLSMVNNGGGVCDDSGQREYLAGSVTWMHTQPQLGIVGATCPDGDAANWDVGLFLTPAEQSEESAQVVSEENVGYFDWSPDDRLIVYDQRNTYSPQFNDTIREGLWLLNVASGIVQPVLDTGHSPAWRPAVAPEPTEQTSDTAPTSKATPKNLLDQLVEFPVPAIAQCVTLTICLW